MNEYLLQQILEALEKISTQLDRTRKEVGLTRLEAEGT